MNYFYRGRSPDSHAKRAPLRGARAADQAPRTAARAPRATFKACWLPDRGAGLAMQKQLGRIMCFLHNPPSIGPRYRVPLIDRLSAQ